MRACILSFILCALIANRAEAIDNTSTYQELGSDFLVQVNNLSGQVLLTTTLQLTADQDVLFSSDGRFYPWQQNGLAVMEIRLDGGLISNGSAFDFRSASRPEQRSFNCIGLSHVLAGSHTVQLVGYNHPSIKGGQFEVGSGTNLSVIVHPANNAISASLSADSGVINVQTGGIQSPNPLPYQPILTISPQGTGDPIIALASSRVIGTSIYSQGDAMIGIYVDGACPANDSQQWSVSDLTTDSGMHAPVFSQRILTGRFGAATIQLAATELPIGSENQVQYRVGSQANLIALSGGTPIFGSATQNSNTNQCTPNSYFGPFTGTYWNKSFTVSPGQNGNVFLLLKTRVLDCNASDGPGTASLKLNLDGNRVGNYGIMQYAQGDGCHQNTLSSSYLAKNLSIGTHTVSATIYQSGLPNLAASGDLGLIYFGN